MIKPDPAYAYKRHAYKKKTCIQSLNISIGTVMKNPEKLKFVPGHLKTKKVSKHAVQKLPYLVIINYLLIINYL